MHELMSSAGVQQGMVGMANRGTLDFAVLRGDCSASPSDSVKYEVLKDMQYLVFPTFRNLIGRADSAGARKAGTALAHLFEYECLDSLSRAFRRASEIYEKDSKLMMQYVAEWNRIFAAKEAETISIKVAISNIGRFDSFVRTDAKVAVGPKGSQEKLSFKVSQRIAKDQKDDAMETPTQYLQIKSRSAVLATFYSRLLPDLQKKLHGAYNSEQAFLRLGILASAGPTEGEALSQTAPFSSKTRLEFDQRVDNMKIAF
jgi:hypothetical protein